MGPLLSNSAMQGKPQKLIHFSGSFARFCQVRDQLFDILEVHASSGAFAAMRADGVVITWDHPLSGGDSRSVRKQLAEGLGPEAQRAV